ncbi:MAG: polymer-forming cytoskeletal protein [Candidatus Eisenbacteria bacterium]|nr:polymer-forming cytoskeletal protein [Candidatus Eisenbacteria bacterium]
MFARDEERTGADMNTIIGEGTILKGDVKVEGSIQVDGEFEGTIDATDTLVVGESGKVDGDVTVANAAIGGRMYGNVFASGKIELQRGSQLLGDIKTRGLVIEDGVVFQGNCQMGDVVDPPVRRRDESEPGLDEVAVEEEEYEDADL